MRLTLYQHSFVMIVLLVIFTPSVHVLTNIELEKREKSGIHRGQMEFVIDS